MNGMDIAVEVLVKFWYLVVLIIIAAILELFKPQIKGYFGEKSVGYFLSKLDKTKYLVINNIMVKVGDRTSQIDHLVVSNFGIFVIETKNYKGWIIGNEDDYYWKQVIYKRKEKLYNPIKQNHVHIKALKEKLLDFTDINYISIVAFTTGADLKVTTTTDVVYTINLLKTIKKYNKVTIAEDIKNQIFMKLNASNVDSKENRKTHVEAIHKNLEEKNNNIKSDICPRCGGKLVARTGKYGPFKGCSNFPKCRFTLK